MSFSNIFALVVLIALIAIGYILFSSNADTLSTSTLFPKVPAGQNIFSAKNSTFAIDGTMVTLVNGEAVSEAAPGSASKNITRYFGNEARGDLNADNKEDIAFLVTSDRGGSGRFYYAVAALRAEGGYKTTSAYFLGDRIAPQATNIIAGEIYVNYAERKPGEPMSAFPSVGVTKQLRVAPDNTLISTGS